MLDDVGPKPAVHHSVLSGPGTVKDGRSPGLGLCAEKIQNALTSKQIQVGGDLIHQIHLKHRKPCGFQISLLRQAWML